MTLEHSFRISLFILVLQIHCRDAIKTPLRYYYIRSVNVSAFKTDMGVALYAPVIIYRHLFYMIISLAIGAFMPLILLNKCQITAAYISAGLTTAL